jgi:serine/threonine protein kinase
VAERDDQSGLPQISGYRVVRRLGQGGMAEVFLAVQLSLERQVALKLMSFDGDAADDLAARFEREARTIAKLDHPHIVGIYDVGRTRDGRLY